MDLDTNNLQQDPPPAIQESDRWPVKKILNVVLLICLSLTAYLGYAYISSALHADRVQEQAQLRRLPVVQLDVLNGCGVKGAAAAFTGYLRTTGFDVVEMKNYKMSHMPLTLVVDRVGDLVAARSVAVALGVSTSNIIQQLNPDYFVEVSVIIGEDFQTLRPYR